MPKPLPPPPTPTPPDDPAEFARPLDFETQAGGPVEFAQLTKGSAMGNVKPGLGS